MVSTIKSNLTLDELRKDVENGAINTVVVGVVDMQTRLIGKRLTGKHFVESGHKRLNACRYFLAMNIEGHPDDGYAIANWDQGFSNCIYRPDLSTLRRTPWMDATALVICDAEESNGEPLYCYPRAVLKRQIERLAKRNLSALFASELECYVFNESHESARQKHWTELKTSAPHFRCLHLLASSQDEHFMRRIRTNLEAAGVPLEATHPEYGPGQQEFNLKPANALEMADRQVVLKHAVQEITQQMGLSATFMAKYNRTQPGSSCHIHMSLCSSSDEQKNLFYDPNDSNGMSKLMKSWTAGLVKYVREYIYFLAPYINSYKRLQPSSWAPTKICWVLDNRTGPFRVCQPGGSGVHLECRVGGADLNPYLAFAALIAAGLAGIDEGLELSPPTLGNIYNDQKLRELPTSLREATEELAASKMLLDAFGKNVLDHYVNAAKCEQTDFDKQVTDWELMRGFERC